MTAHDKNLPSAAVSSGPAPDAPVTRARRDGARDKPAVIVWRVSADTVDDEDAAGVSDAGDSPLTTRLASHLVAIYSDVHSTVVDFDADDNLRHAAEASGRNYLAVTSPADLAQLAEKPRQAALIMLRWPRPATTTPDQNANVLLTACRRHLADDGSAVIAVTAATAGQAGTTYTEHEQILLPAAQAAGLRHLHDIVPLDATDGRDAFTYATPDDTTAVDRDRDADTPRQTASTTLVIFGHSRRRS